MSAEKGMAKAPLAEAITTGITKAALADSIAGRTHLGALNDQQRVAHFIGHGSDTVTVGVS